MYLQAVRVSGIHRLSHSPNNARLSEFSALCSCKLYYLNYVRLVILFALRNSEVSAIKSAEWVHIIR